MFFFDSNISEDVNYPLGYNRIIKIVSSSVSFGMSMAGDRELLDDI
jgi:hypothetical protein